MFSLLLKYALAVAGQEKPGNRELGAIHLVKYVYLADLAYADRHRGDTLTAVAWRFHNLISVHGRRTSTPLQLIGECFFVHKPPHRGGWVSRIAPVVAAVGAQERRYSNPRYEDEA